MTLGPLGDRRVAVAVVAVVATLVFANSLPNRFAYDDQHIILVNQDIHSLATLPGALVRPYWPGDYGRELGLWRPVTTALLGVQYVIGGGAPWLFHTVNVLAHASASVLAFLLLLELIPYAAALAAGLLFAVHPVHVEAVANVIGIAEIVSAVALLAACLVHVRSGDRSGWRSALAIGALYLVGFGAKESAVTLPGLVFLLDAARGRLGFSDVPAYLRARWRAYLVMALVAAAMLAARLQILGSIAHPFAPIGADLLTEIPRIWTLGEIWTHYVRLWVFPLDLSSDYSPDVLPVSTSWHATNTLGAVLVLVLLVATWVAWRRPALTPERASARAAGFGALWFMVAISPVSNTLFLSGVLLAERTLYLPSVGLAAATGWLVVRLYRDRPKVVPILFAVALAAAALRSWTRSPTWYDNPTMLATLIEEHPQSGRSQWILGDALLRQGRTSEALRSYRFAIGILGTHYQLLTEISKQLLEFGHYDVAESLLVFAVENNPEFPLGWGLLALIRAENGDAIATERYARASLERWPNDPTRRHLLTWALSAQGRSDEARDEHARALGQGIVRIWPHYVHEAYEAQARGDSASVGAALDSAAMYVTTELGRGTLDSIRSVDFTAFVEPIPADSADSGVRR